ncbi:hypothetical protein D5S17_23090 [Pseudonocardiaceae bacterium YIM PH 21723]|nr:hypothetical protein D5S17_23090 [Pseudonocardiaceae bacterium YIM PH 21723]
MHIAFFTMPAHGHVNPVLGIVGELVARGHRVSYGTTSTFADRVTQAGATAVRYDSLLPDDSDPDSRWPEDLDSVGKLLVAESRQAYPQMAAAFADDLPDIAVGEDLFGGGMLMSAVRGIPRVPVWPYFAAHSDGPIPEGAFTPYDDWLIELGLGKADEYVWRALDGGLVLLAREFQPAGDTFGEKFHFVGPCLTDRAFQGDWPDSPDDRPLLYVSLGTGFNDRPDFYRTCFAAFGGLPWRVVISVGQWVDIAALGTPPANVELHRHVPQLKVLERADMFLTHAGMGSTQEALYFGVPTVAVPQSADQPANAARLAELGLGVHLDPATVTAAELREAVLAVHGDPEMAERLAVLKAATRSAGGAQRAADIIEAAAQQ